MFGLFKRKSEKEKVLTFDLNDKEKEALNNTLTEVEKTVQETGL